MSDPVGEAGAGAVPLTERLPAWVVLVLPLALLAVVVGLFFVASPLAGVQGGQPLPDVAITHVTLPSDETVVLHVVNSGPQPVTVEQVLVGEAYWDFSVGGGDATLAPMESARIVIPYHWNPGWDLGVTLLLSDGATFHHTIVAPQATPDLGLGLLWSLALVGLFVGVIPVGLGMLWFPYIRRMRPRWLHAVLTFAAGVLAFLAIDAGVEALELAHAVPAALDGTILVVLGAASAFLLVQAVSSRNDRAGADGDARPGLRVAYLVALGIGLHNLGEGLAIGSAYALGRVSLGAFLVVGFMLHNVTEGPAVVAPLARGERPRNRHFLALGVLAGAPVVLGGWLGSLAYSPTLGALFLALGVGAIVQVDVEIAGMIRDSGERLGTATNLLAFLAGLATMYVTDLLVAM
ncbi:MAG: ZIP family metal transporter [Haloferacaceae archaeon]